MPYLADGSWSDETPEVVPTVAEEAETEGEAPATDPTPDTCEECGVTAGSVTLVSSCGDPDDMVLLCASCTEACGHCGISVQGNRRTFVRVLGRICDECFANECSDCERCRDRTRDADLAHCEYYGGDVCERCAEIGRDESEHQSEREEEEEEERAREESDRRVIRSYHSSTFAPIPGVWSAKHGGRLFGVELEVESAGENCKDLAATILQASQSIHAQHFAPDRAAYLPLVQMESDGSLSDGFEIISQPLGMDDQRKLWAGILQRDNVRGLRSHNTTTCGLHVHMTRAGITGTQLGRIIVFMNNPENERLIRAIGRRYSSEYCKVKYKTVHDTDSNDRYEAVNITGHRTIEFRIFKGSLRRDAVIAAVEFAHAVAEYCADDAQYDVGDPVDPMDFSTASFLRFIQTAPSITRDTAILRTYLVSRGIEFLALPASSL